MPILSTDIKFKQSGPGNLGGAISADDVPTTLHALFDAITGSESLGGDTEYRCIYVKNNHATLTLFNTVVFLQSNTPAESTRMDIGLGSGAVNAAEPAIELESSAPAGVTFGAPTSYGTGLLVGDLPPGASKAIWLRRTVTAGASAYSGDSALLAAQGDTTA